MVARREAHQNSRWHARQTQHIKTKGQAPATARTAPRATRYSNCSPALFTFSAACSRAVGPAGPCLFRGMAQWTTMRRLRSLSMSLSSSLPATTLWPCPPPERGRQVGQNKGGQGKKKGGRERRLDVIRMPPPPLLEEERGRRRKGGGRSCGANGGEQRCCCVEKIWGVGSRMLVAKIAASFPLAPQGSHCRM